jgi:hypothetical protein
MSGFDVIVQESWSAPSTHMEPCQRLFRKFRDTGKALSKWGCQLFSSTKVTMHTTLLVILHFDKARENR